MHSLYTGSGSASIGGEIRRLRVLRGLRQDDLAARLGVTRQAVSKWENDVSYPDIILLPALADLLGVTVDGLLRACGRPGTNAGAAPSEDAADPKGAGQSPD